MVVHAVVALLPLPLPLLAAGDRDGTIAYEAFGADGMSIGLGESQP